MSDLFTEVSVEQQEVVSGGIDFTFTGTRYDAKLSNLTSFSTSTPFGTASGSTGFDNRLATAGNTLTGLVAPAILTPAPAVVTFP